MIFKLPLRCRINQEEYVLILNSVCYVRGDVLNFCGCFLRLRLAKGGQQPPSSLKVLGATDHLSIL